MLLHILYMLDNQMVQKELMRVGPLMKQLKHCEGLGHLQDSRKHSRWTHCVSLDITHYIMRFRGLLEFSNHVSVGCILHDGRQPTSLLAAGIYSALHGYWPCL